MVKNGEVVYPNPLVGSTLEFIAIEEERGWKHCIEYSDDGCVAYVFGPKLSIACDCLEVEQELYIGEVARDAQAIITWSDGELWLRK